MLLPIRKPDGRVYQTLICDACRKPIREHQFTEATVDFNPIDDKDLDKASPEQLLASAHQRHFHADCCPRKCTAGFWQKLDRVLYPMVVNLFDATNSPIAKAAEKSLRSQPADPSFP